MTEEAPGREVRTVVVQGRDIVVQRLVDTQMMLMARDAKRLQDDKLPTNVKLDAASRMFDILESAIVEPADVEYMEELMVKGKLDLRELTEFVTVFQVEEASAGKPRVRRGRPPIRAKA